MLEVIQLGSGSKRLGGEPKPIFHPSEKVQMALGAWNEADWLLSVPWPCEYYKDRIWRMVMGGGEVPPSRPLSIRRWHGDPGPGRLRKWDVTR